MSWHRPKPQLQNLAACSLPSHTNVLHQNSFTLQPLSQDPYNLAVVVVSLLTTSLLVFFFLFIVTLTLVNIHDRVLLP